MSEVVRIAVTGGFGAIGSNLVASLQQRAGVEVHVLDNLSAGTANVKPTVAFTHLDISNGERVAGFFRSYRPHVVYHLAAHFANQNSVDHPLSDVATNVIGLINLLEAQKENAELRKLVYASSSCVYGDLSEMSEQASVGPYETPYSINKYVGELYCRYYSKIQNVPTVCARVFNNYGPGELPGPYRNVIPNFILRALREEDIIVTGNGEETRDFTFVGDTVDLLQRLETSQFCNSEIFNGGTGVQTTIGDLARLVVWATGSESSIRFVPRRDWDKVQHRCADIRRSCDLLHYQPQTLLKDGIVDTVRWIAGRLGFSLPPSAGAYSGVSRDGVHISI